MIKYYDTLPHKTWKQGEMVGLVTDEERKKLTKDKLDAKTIDVGKISLRVREIRNKEASAKALDNIPDNNEKKDRREQKAQRTCKAETPSLKVNAPVFTPGQQQQQLSQMQSQQQPSPVQPQESQHFAPQSPLQSLPMTVNPTQSPFLGQPPMGALPLTPQQQQLSLYWLVNQLQQSQMLGGGTDNTQGNNFLRTNNSSMPGCTVPPLSFNRQWDMGHNMDHFRGPMMLTRGGGDGNHTYTSDNRTTRPPVTQAHGWDTPRERQNREELSQSDNRRRNSMMDSDRDRDDQWRRRNQRSQGRGKGGGRSKHRSSFQQGS